MDILILRDLRLGRPDAPTVGLDERLAWKLADLTTLPARQAVDKHRAMASDEQTG